MSAPARQVSPAVKRVTDRILARCYANAEASVPLLTGADPDATCVELGIRIEAGPVPETAEYLLASYTRGERERVLRHDTHYGRAC